jgi:hypothetical protein
MPQTWHTSAPFKSLIRSGARRKRLPVGFRSAAVSFVSVILQQPPQLVIYGHEQQADRQPFQYLQLPFLHLISSATMSP